MHTPPPHRRKWKTFKPPGGVGRGGPRGPGFSRGDGWGGPAKGPGHGGPAKGAGKGPAFWTDPAKAAAKEAVGEHLVAQLYRLAQSAERQETRIAAAEAVLDRIHGKPVAMSVEMVDNGKA